MITARATFESPGGHFTIQKAIAAPETFGEMIHLFFRKGYTIGNHEQEDHWYPVFDREVSATYSPELRERIAKQKYWESELHPVTFNGYPYEND